MIKFTCVILCLPNEEGYDGESEYVSDYYTADMYWPRVEWLLFVDESRTEWHIYNISLWIMQLIKYVCMTMTMKMIKYVDVV